MNNGTDTESAVELRSDTFTKPTPAMRRAMAEAEVGDDVYGEDPAVNRLQARAAELFEREAALFVPSGCMGNLLAIRVHARPTDEVICEAWSHVSLYEMGSMCSIAGCLPRTVRVPGGILTWEIIEPLIREKIYYDSQTKLVTLENTSNMHGGVVYPQEVVDSICDKAHAAGLKMHLDGARIFNASVATGHSVARMTRKFDSVMFCLSKALGAPVGSMLVGSRDFIAESRIGRKMLGGGMRQAGVIAAAGLVALEQTPKVLHVDHENARRLAEGVAQIKGVSLDPNKVTTNIVIIDVKATGHTAEEVCAMLERRGVLCQTGAGKYDVRMVTHYDVDRAGIDRAIAVTQDVLAGRVREPAVAQRMN